MRHSHIAMVAFGVVLFALATALPNCFGDEVKCTGKYKGGLAPTSDELKEILKQHATWLKDGGPWNSKLAGDPRRANLCGANLIRANLSGIRVEGNSLGTTDVDLRYANLTGANLEGMYLHVRLSGGTSPARILAMQNLLAHT